MMIEERATTGQTEAAFKPGAKPRARGRKSAEKRLLIMRAAITIINDKSFALATMTEIAASLDLRDATLYYYFPNKQALAYACHVLSLERFERLLDLAEGSGGSGIEKLRRFLHVFLEDSSLNGPQLYFGDHSYLEETQRSQVLTWADRLRDRLEAFIRQGMADGSVVSCEAGLVVQLMLGTLIWLAKWTPGTKGLTVKRLDAAIEAFAFQGLACRDIASAGDDKRRSSVNVAEG